MPLLDCSLSPGEISLSGMAKPLPLEFDGPPSEIQALISENADYTRRVFEYLDLLGVQHSGRISSATLGSVCGAHERTWGKWIGGEREMPKTARRLLALVIRFDLP